MRLSLFNTFAFAGSALAFAASGTALAHMHVGTYQGKTQDGTACSFEVTKVYFADNLQHPLNERVEVVFEQNAFTLSHPPVVSAEQGRVFFDHDQLVGTKGYARGGQAFILKMDHSEGKDGPSEAIILQHDYRDAAQSTRKTCLGLVHAEH